MADKLLHDAVMDAIQNRIGLGNHESDIAADAALSAIAEAGYVVVPAVPTDAMHTSARDWSAAKYGKPIGIDASMGCYRAMLAASQTEGRK
jgi:hypothetical protein